MRTPYPYQVEGIKALVQNSQFILADDMGLGKTYQLIRAALQLRPSYVLIVCPAVVRGVWAKELRAEGVTDITVIQKGGDIPRSKALKGWIVVSYDLFRQATTAKWGRPDIMIADEAHKIKSIDKPTNAKVSAIAAMAGRFWPATGTPVKNHYGEFFALARLVIPFEVLQQHGVETFLKWRNKFCIVVTETIYVRGGKQRQITRIAGSKNPKELGDLIKPYMLRRKKERVLLDLPALRWQPLTVNLVGYIEYTEKQLDALIWAAENGTTPSFDKDGEHIATLRSRIASAKVPATAQIAIDHCESTQEPLVIFCCYLDAIHALAAALREKKLRVEVIVGGVGDDQRTAIVENFQKGEVDVFIGQIRAAGVGITLTRAWRSLFMDLDFAPTENAQARDRLHRIGQEQVVLSQYLVSEHPVDAQVNEIIAKKTAAISLLEEAVT